MFAQLTTVALASFVASCILTRVLVAVLRRGAVLDIPNARSSHAVPTPRGGGIAVIGIGLVAWLGLCGGGVGPAETVVVVFAAAGLALVSWLDDLRGLSPGVRLLAQFAAAAAGMLALPHGLPFQGWLPAGLGEIAGALLWVWFINLFNFMDGIDGLAASEAVAVGVGIAVVAIAGAAGGLALAAPALAVAGSALGFLVWNWAPARIFLGDVGSVPLGYLLGFLLLELARRGAWQAALILPLYFLADATITLLRRLAHGERVWQAHREHFYQRAVQNGLSHAAVVLRVIVANLVLVACAWVAVKNWGFAALAVAALTVTALLVALSRGGRRA